jgi:hypothetical protein
MSKRRYMIQIMVHILHMMKNKLGHLNNVRNREHVMTIGSGHIVPSGESENNKKAYS